MPSGHVLPRRGVWARRRSRAAAAVTWVAWSMLKVEGSTEVSPEAHVVQQLFRHYERCASSDICASIKCHHVASRTIEYEIGGRPRKSKQKRKKYHEQLNPAHVKRKAMFYSRAKAQDEDAKWKLKMHGYCLVQSY